MKAMVISGSRNPQGQTAAAAGAVIEGLRANDVEVELAFLPPLTIERCRQCDQAGWGACRSEGRCVIEDDFARLVEGLRAADCAVFATPVYFSDLSESLRAFLDRLRRITCHETGKAGITDTPTVGLCVSGGGPAGACAAILEKTLATCGFSVVDMVPVRRQNLAAKQDILHHTGAWLATGAPEKA